LDSTGSEKVSANTLPREEVKSTELGTEWTILIPLIKKHLLLK